MRFKIWIKQKYLFISYIKIDNLLNSKIHKIRISKYLFTYDKFIKKVEISSNVNVNFTKSIYYIIGFNIKR